MKVTTTTFVKAALVSGLLSLFSTGANAQLVSINLDGTPPNTNAMLDIKSTGLQGKGLLIPRFTELQRTTPLIPGGLLNLTGQLHGGAAQGLIVYQTDGTQGFYYNTSTTATPSWQYLSSGVSGATGPAGPAGPTGAAGTSEAWHTGSGAPSNSLGSVGDWYFRTSNNQILEKTGASTWTSRATITGATGPTGAAGAAGATGAAGPTGAQGPTGAAGTQGPTGASGVVEQWHSGSTAPANSLGSVGDWYFRTGTGDIYEKTGSSVWTFYISAKGTTGATGADGADGTSSAWYSGNGAVGNGQYNVGDWYLRTTTGDVFEKTGNLTWTLRMNIMGPTGPTGSGGGGSSSGWDLTGNSISSGQFIGTTNSQSLLFKVSNNTAGYLGVSDKDVMFGYNVNYAGGGDKNVGIGNQVTVYGNVSKSVAIGNEAQVQPGSGSTDDIAIGNQANVTGGSAFSYSTAIGSSAQVQASNGLAIGKSTNVNAQYGIAIGDAAQAQGNSAIVIGKSAYSNSTDAISIGTSAQAQGTNSIAIGDGANANQTGAIAIGSGNSTTQAQGQYSISIGYKAYTSATDAIAIGDFAQAQGNSTIVIGNNIYNGTANTVAIGNSSNTSVKLNGATSNSYALQVGTSSSNGNGAYLTKGGVWTNASDRNLKEDITTLDANDILNKISNLSITKWKYKGTDEYHIGPMAQDFKAAFNLGTDDKRISSIDPAGVALVAIQALNAKVEQQQKTIDSLIKEIAEFKNK